MMSSGLRSLRCGVRVALILWPWSGAAQAQVQWIHHWSTPYGDATAAEAQLQIGLGMRDAWAAQAEAVRQQTAQEAQRHRSGLAESYWQRSYERHQAARLRAQLRQLLDLRRRQQAAWGPAPGEVLDLATGEIAWPAALRRDETVGARHQVQKAVHAWYFTEALSRAEADELDAEVLSLRAGLKDRIHEVRPQEYVDARRLLDRLANLARAARFRSS